MQDLEKQAPDAAPRFLEQCGLLSENVRELAMNVADFSGTVELDEERKAAMVSNLLVVLCGNRDAQPVVNSGSLY